MRFGPAFCSLDMIQASMAGIGTEVWRTAIETKRSLVT